MASGAGNGALFHAWFSSKALPIAGTVILLLVSSVGALLLRNATAQDMLLADHQRWLIALQHQQDSLRYEQGRRTPIIEAAAKTAEMLHDLRIAVAEIRQQIASSNQALARIEQLQRRELRTLEGQ